MSTHHPNDNTPIPSTMSKERGCSSLWGLAPSDAGTRGTRGPVEEFFQDRVCGTKIACSAWADAFEHERDQPAIVTGTVDGSWVSGSDLPFNHSSHDWVFEVDLDDGFLGYHSDKNPTNAAGRQLLHCEWELNALRNAYGHLPSAGDRVWVAGRWAFDCAHPDNCKTEIHPPQAVASWRAEPFVDEISGDPVDGIQIKVIVSGHGGVCHRTKTAAKDLRFAVPIPASPGPSAELVIEVDSNGENPEVIPHIDAQDHRADILLPFRSGDDLPTTSAYLAAVEIGWRNPASQDQWKRVVVRLDSLTVLHTHDIRPVGDGEWHLWANINGTWHQLLNDRRVTKGQTMDLAGKEIPLTLARPASLDEPVISISSTGWEGDSIDTICMFEDAPAEGARGFPELPDLPSIPDIPDRDEVFAWMLAQAGKLQNERLGQLRAAHTWDELAGGGSFVAESDFSGGPDFELRYSVRAQ
jgi:hypothetical protein